MALTASPQLALGMAADLSEPGILRQIAGGAGIVIPFSGTIDPEATVVAATFQHDSWNRASFYPRYNSWRMRIYSDQQLQVVLEANRTPSFSSAGRLINNRPVATWIVDPNDPANREQYTLPVPVWGNYWRVHLTNPSAESVATVYAGEIWLLAEGGSYGETPAE